MQEIKLPSRFNLVESFGKVSWSVRRNLRWIRGMVRHESVNHVRRAALIAVSGFGQTRRWARTGCAVGSGKARRGQAGRGSVLDRCCSRVEMKKIGPRWEFGSRPCSICEITAKTTWRTVGWNMGSEKRMRNLHQNRTFMRQIANSCLFTAWLMFTLSANGQTHRAREVD